MVSLVQFNAWNEHVPAAANDVYVNDAECTTYERPSSRLRLLSRSSGQQDLVPKSSNPTFGVSNFGGTTMVSQCFELDAVGPPAGRNHALHTYSPGAECIRISILVFLEICPNI